MAKKPWGSSKIILKSEECVVKMLRIKPGAKLSWQYHERRDESWTLLAGTPVIVVAPSSTSKSVDTRIYPRYHANIPRGILHRIDNSQEDTEAIILEVCFGKYDRSDKFRVEDEYNRL